MIVICGKSEGDEAGGKSIDGRGGKLLSLEPIGQKAYNGCRMSKQKKTIFRRGRRNFFTGLAVVLPVIISIGIALWLFNKAVDVSDILLYPFRFVPGVELTDIWKNLRTPGSRSCISAGR